MCCRVRGVDRLRVVDGSVMPTITSGHVNAPIIMMAEKASDLIRGEYTIGMTPEKEWEEHHQHYHGEL